MRWSEAGYFAKALKNKTAKGSAAYTYNCEDSNENRDITPYWKAALRQKAGGGIGQQGEGSTITARTTAKVGLHRMTVQADSFGIQIKTAA